MSSDGLRYADDLGPAKILHLHEPASGLKAIVVVDNVVLGPAIGGVRIVADAGAQGLSPDETWRPCMDALLADARRGRLAAGIEAALDALGAILRERVPGAWRTATKYRTDRCCCNGRL